MFYIDGRPVNLNAVCDVSADPDDAFVDATVDYAEWLDTLSEFTVAEYMHYSEQLDELAGEAYFEGMV